MDQHLNTEKESGRIRVVVISDTHNKASEIKDLPQGDVLIHGGDFTQTGHPSEVHKFNDFLRQSKYEVKIVIAGNHDFTFDTLNYKTVARKFHGDETDTIDPAATKAMLTDCVYLEDSSYNLQGYHVYGSPYVPKTLNYFGFNLNTEEETTLKWNLIPVETDILITHGPPKGILDVIEKDGSHVGCPILRDIVLQRVKPMYHIFGHVHEQYGLVEIDGTKFINASSVTKKYETNLQPPFTFDLPMIQ